MHDSATGGASRKDQRISETGTTGSVDGPGATDGPRVRPMHPADAAAVLRIYAEAIAERIATFETRPPAPDTVGAWPQAGPVVVVELGGAVVAWARATAYRPRRAAYSGVGEFSVYVARQARGVGAGRAAVAGLLDACRRAGYWKLVSRVFPENAASRALCRAMGFREVGVYQRHARLDGRWRDCVILERALGSPEPATEPAPPPPPPPPSPSPPEEGSARPPDEGSAPPTGGPAEAPPSLEQLWSGTLRAQALAVEAAVARAPDVLLQAEVAGCPGYTVAEVLRHLGAVYRLVTPWMQQGRRPRAHTSEPVDGDVRRWFAEGWRAVAAELTAAPAGTPTASWNPADTTRGFWRRRMAHETAVHAFDVLTATGGDWWLDAAVAEDGVDEALRLWLGTRLGAQVGGDGSVVRVRAGARVWTVGLHPHTVEVHEGVAVGGADVGADATVGGDPAAVYLWAWGRGPGAGSTPAAAGVVVEGDAAAVDLLRSALARAMV